MNRACRVMCTRWYQKVWLIDLLGGCGVIRLSGSWVGFSHGEMNRDIASRLHALFGEFRYADVMFAGG